MATGEPEPMPLSPCRSNGKSPKKKSRISVNDILVGDFHHIAKSLGSPSSYATKRPTFASKPNSLNVTQDENKYTFQQDLLEMSAEAPTPSRPPHRRLSQCLQGFSSSPADDSRLQRGRHQSVGLRRPASPSHMISSPVKGKEHEQTQTASPPHRAFEWRKKANTMAQQHTLNWTNSTSQVKVIQPLSMTGPASTPPAHAAATSPPTLQATVWSPDTAAPYYMSSPHMFQQQQQQQQHAAAALWNQQHMMYQQYLIQQNHLNLNHGGGTNFENLNCTYPPPKTKSRSRTTSYDSNDRSSRRRQYKNNNGSSSSHSSGNGSYESSGRHSSKRNSTLEQWKNSEDRKKWRLRDVVGNVVAFAQDTTGTHFLQSCLDESSAAELIAVYDELNAANMSSLLLHNTGNWSVKKLVELLSANELEHFFQTHIVGRVNSLAYHVHGARVLKAALIRASSLKTVVLVNVALTILNDLSSDLVRAMCHESATHIFQRSFNVLSSSTQRAAIVDKLMSCSSDLQRIGTHTYGSRALQCVIGTSAQMMAPSILKVAPALAQSAAGNFVLQSMLQNGNSTTRKKLVQTSTVHLGQFACNKHASHFVERCIDMASEEELTSMVNTMSSSPPSSTGGPRLSNVPVMVMMCNNNYANFVVGSIVARLQHTGQNELKMELRCIMEMWEQPMRATNVGDKTFLQSMTALGKKF